ncbi:hypothetical protein SAMN05216294_2474 [Flagellimonas zhangzhouensis]|nr:hypothetical protein SAMN05216294_2474 [Allomuricauda zhangzhouensis]
MNFVFIFINKTYIYIVITSVSIVNANRFILK